VAGDPRPAAAVVELVHDLAAPARVHDVIAYQPGAVVLVVPVAIDPLATWRPLAGELRTRAEHDDPPPMAGPIVSGAAQVVVAAWTGLSCNRPHMAQPYDDRVNRHLEDCGPEPGAVDTLR
jgi:hypothetical protein